MRRLIVLIIFISACKPQPSKKVLVPVCNCPAQITDTDNTPESIFSFSNGKALALCQKSNSNDSFPGRITYADFAISECGTDTLVDSRDARSYCTLEMSSDTLIIKQLSLIALSPKLDMIHIPWLITKHYYQNNKLQSVKQFNPEIHYTTIQIEKAFERLDTAKWRTHHEFGDSKEAYRMMRFASQMMVAAISGDENAEIYFYKIKEKFKPEGAYELWFREMEDIIYFARNNKQR